MPSHAFAHHFIRQQNFVFFMNHWDTLTFQGSSILLKIEICFSLVKKQKKFVNVVVRVLRSSHVSAHLHQKVL